jgi:very-short-patch-repair endonuclease
MDSVTGISEPLHARFAERLIALSQAPAVAQLCIQVLGWGPPARWDRLEFLEAFAGLMPSAGLPRIVMEGHSLLEGADRMAVAGFSIGLRVNPIEWERFLAGNDWRRHAARWRLAPVLGGGGLGLRIGVPGVSGKSAIPSEATRQLVGILAPGALPQLEAAAGLIKKDEGTDNGVSGEARSAVELLLFTVLDARPLTGGCFTLNAPLDFGFGTRQAEGDLVAHGARLVVEIDGYFHFRDPEDYRRDRRKDAAFQEHGWFVLRFLAEDIVRDLEGVLARIDGHLARLTPAFKS